MTDYCQHTLDRLDDWIDGLLDAVERGGIEDHLAQCAACRETFHSQQELAGELFRLGGVADRIANTPSRRAKLVVWSPMWMRIAAVIVLAIGITSGAAWYMHQQTLVQSPQNNMSTVANRIDNGAQIASREFKLDVPPEDGRLVVNMESKNPKVRIVWLYESSQRPPEPLNKANGVESPSNG